MGLSRRRYNDVLYLMPVRLGKEQLPPDTIRMLYCDAKGRIQTYLMKRSVYELARRHGRKVGRTHKNYATLGLEISPDKITPLTVEISAEHVWALEHILKHSLKNGKLPDVLKKYPKQIIALGEARREELITQHKRRERKAYLEAMPRVLSRLPYYSEDNIEVSIPIFKAEYRYPLIMLERLPPGEHNSPKMQRLLIMDSDGDLAVIKVPLELIDDAEKSLAKVKKADDKGVRIICSQSPKGLALSYLTISQAQTKALDIITSHFERTGHGIQPVSVATQTVLARARDVVSSLPE